MSGLLNKIANAVAGHSNNNAAGEDASLKEGAQYRDTGAQAQGKGNGPSYAPTSGPDLNQGNLGQRASGVAGLNPGAPVMGAPASGYNAPIGGATAGQNTASGAGVGAGATHNRNTSIGKDLKQEIQQPHHLHHASAGSDAALAQRQQHATSTAGLGHNQRATAGAVGGENAMTRSEEHLLVGKEKVNGGSAGLHKYVTTEQVSTAVPIMTERAVIEREPISEANRGNIGATEGLFKEQHAQVNLTAERVVAEKDVVPIERIHLRKEAETTQQHLQADLRKEHIEVQDNTKQIDSTAGFSGTNVKVSDQLGQGQGLGQRQGHQLGHHNQLAADRQTASDRRM